MFFDLQRLWLYYTDCLHIYIFIMFICLFYLFTGRDAIQQYYCNCIVGKRTVGCCAHVMTVIWYISWARFEQNITPPAQFLDDVLSHCNEIQGE